MEFIAEEKGYLMAYTSNETNEDLNVFMDQMTLLHTTGSIVRVDDYYPFGMVYKTSELSGKLSNKFLFNGKEKQELTEWYDYGARMYDATIGRWGVVGSLADVTRSYSPYNYVYNNPVRFVDRFGLYADPWAELYGGDGGGGSSSGGSHSGGGFGGSIGPGSGNHWSDWYRDPWANAGLMSSSIFNNFYHANQMNNQEKAEFASSIGDPGYIVNTNQGTYIYADKSFQTDFAGGGLENWYRAQSAEANTGSNGILEGWAFGTSTDLTITDYPLNLFIEDWRGYTEEAGTIRHDDQKLQYISKGEAGGFEASWSFFIF